MRIIFIHWGSRRQNRSQLERKPSRFSLLAYIPKNANPNPRTWNL